MSARRCDCGSYITRTDGKHICTDCALNSATCRKRFNDSSCSAYLPRSRFIKEDRVTVNVDTSDHESIKNGFITVITNFLRGKK